MLYIRADGNAEIGTGHVMRCLSIAHSVREMGGDCTFITADHNMAPLLEEHGFRQLCLDSEWNCLDREITRMEALIRQESIQTLLVDSYFATADYLARLHHLTHVACMDDLNDFVRPCSTLINYNLYADAADYGVRYPGVRLLLSPRYAPLRREFQGLPRREVRPEAGEVLVTTGGSDPLNIAGQLVQRAKQLPETAGLTYHIIAGRFNRHLPMLTQLENEHPGVVIHRNVQRMSELMLSCDLAISAAGSTLYELCACGTPTICFAWADNQLPGAAAFGSGYMPSAGDFRAEPDRSIGQILSFVSTLRRDAAARQTQANALQSLVDGQGAARIAAALLKTD